MGAQDQRPRFFEGQYLAADDLAAIVDYLRAADARHALGAHSWGIAAGLTLTERPAPGPQGRREVILTPGVAWDGHGRAIVVTRPTRLPETLCASFAYSPLADEPDAGGQPPAGRAVRVWLNYREETAKPPARGFENCEPADQNARVLERFEFVVGDFAAGAARRGNVLVGTDSVAPDQALHHFDPAVPPVPDESVPQQTFPGRARWLVPVGYVRWVAREDDLGYFAERDRVAADRLADCTRALRRYVGVIAERVLGADGNIVLASRFDSPMARHRFTCLLNGPLAADARKDLAWVEGNLRALGDVKLAGSRLQLRDADGQDQQVPMYLARQGDVLVPAAKTCCEAAAEPLAGDPAAPRELRIAIGAKGQNAHKLVVGPETPADAAKGEKEPSLAPRLVVRSGNATGAAEGQVGVNTGDPKAALEVKGDWGSEDGAIRVSGAQPSIRFNEASPWLLQAGVTPPDGFRIANRVGTDWSAVVNITATQRVGIGTADPRNPLSVRAQVPQTSDVAERARWDELVSLEDREGARRWHLNLLRDAAGKHLNFAQTGVADARLFLQAGGRVGIGTAAPTNRLHVDSPDGIRQRRLYLSGDTNWSSITYNAHHSADGSAWVFPDPARKVMTIELDDNGGTPRFEVYSNAEARDSAWRSHFRIRGGDAATEVTELARAGGRVGIGTSTPGARLHVVGDTIVSGNLGVGTVPLEALHVAGSFLRVDGAGGEMAYLGGDASTGGRQPGGRDVQIGSLNSAVDAVHLYNRGDGRFMDLECRGIWRSSQHTTSDETLKEDIRPLADPLATVARLRGVSFRWRPGAPGDRAGEAGRAQHFGVVAQEVAQVLPQLVARSGQGLAVEYEGLIPWLIEAVKALQGEVEGLRAEVAQLRSAQPAPAAKSTQPAPPAGQGAAARRKRAK